MLDSLLIIAGKSILHLSKTLRVGSGSTWPGHIALSLEPSFIKTVLKRSPTKVILIAGTNGKTTTAKLLYEILQTAKKKVFQNKAGANLLNGLASAIIANADPDLRTAKEYAIFEVDENTLPIAIRETNPSVVVVLNLFRDQLDRYGETDTIYQKWKKVIDKLTEDTLLILNADDPYIASLGHETKAKAVYFGLNDRSLATEKKQHAADSLFCPNCSTKLTYKVVYFSHIGQWECSSCGYERPKLALESTEHYPLPGVYNRYNTLAAVLTAKSLQIDEAAINTSIKEFSPAFGRQETLSVQGKKVQLFLSKNPTSFNESLRTVEELGGESLLLILNDRIPDGRDVSWIWDVDFENFLSKSMTLTISGDRAHDMGLRLKYAEKKVQIIPELRTAVYHAIQNTPGDKTLFVLPTYSAMLDVRKILTGKKIL